MRWQQGALNGLLCMVVFCWQVSVAVALSPLPHHTTAKAGFNQVLAVCAMLSYWHLQRTFRLALEEVEELLAARSNLTPATRHRPVDFTRPETYQHWLREGVSESSEEAGDDEEEDDDDESAAAIIRHPGEATAADAQQAGSGAALLAWLQRAAATPGAACKVRGRG